MSNLKPFVKFAGGKSQLLKELRARYPKNIEKYCEPFLGGGAVFFDILSVQRPKEILINDLNSELINVYIQIRDNFSTFLSLLDFYSYCYLEADKLKRREIYYKNRQVYNTCLISDTDNLLKAVLFVFLNKSCFNGLYRVNSKGLFNVPQGTYKRPCICDTELLTEVHKALQGVIITATDYKDCESFIDDKTFVYLDPPYRPLPHTSSFTAYVKSSFSDKEQRELGAFVHIINDKGAKFILSNSDPKAVDVTDNFFDVLYADYKIERVFAPRMINSDSSKRGAISELLISNF